MSRSGEWSVTSVIITGTVWSTHGDVHYQCVIPLSLTSQFWTVCVDTGRVFNM